MQTCCSRSAAVPPGKTADLDNGSALRLLMTKKFYITTPIYYPNARPHVGSAYTTIVCDAIARYKRMCGYDVAFLTGTDEHGEKLQRAADAAGVAVEQFVSEKRELFKDLWRTLGISEYRFVHTSQNPAHLAAVQWMIRKADKAGYVEKKRYEGRYCVFDERYVSDSPDPVNCDICGRPSELISEENYFFKLSAFQERLLKLYEDHPEFVLPDFRMNEVKSFVKSGLRDISISRRRLKWGIPWPDDPAQVVYVWYDALTSYLTGIGFEGDKRSKDFEKYWMGADGPSEVVHMIGKDIIRFHAVYWPAFLMAANDALPAAERLPLPKTIFAHGWIYYEQDKMSKSKGNVVYPEPIVKAFEEFGAPGNDALRYYLLRDTPFGLDGSFSYEGLVQRYNSDLANDLGNLANRTLTLVQTWFEGKVPALDGATETRMIANEAGLSEDARAETLAAFRNRFESYHLADALLKIWATIGDTNRFLNTAEPWKHATSQDAQKELANAGAALYYSLDTVRVSAVVLSPVIPTGSNALWYQLGCEGSIDGKKLDDLSWGDLESKTKVGRPQPIFPRLKKLDILRRLNELADQDRAAEEKIPEVRNQLAAQHERDLIPETETVPGPETRVPSPEPRTPSAEPPKITIDDFAKVDLRVGTILSAEPVPGTTKLLKLQVDIGAEVRQVCAGLAEYYKPEQIIGMKVVLVANLQPRKLRGVESNGMIVAASAGADGRPVLVTFKEDVENGAKLK
jgi:methionyl-tRNA synthetase